MKSCNIVMVYHIYKHHIVLPPPPWCFGFANKQIPFSEKAGAVPEQSGQVPPGQVHLFFPS